MAPPDYRAAVLALSPLRYFRLGESSGTVADDEANVADGTYVGSPALAQAARSVPGNRRVLFDGTDDRVTVSAAGKILGGLTNASFVAWVQVATADYATSSQARILYAETNASAQNYWRVDVATDHAIYTGGGIPRGAIVFVHKPDSGLFTILGTQARIDDNVEHMVAVTKAGSTVRFYLDGQLVGTITVNGDDTFTAGGMQSWLAEWPETGGGHRHKGYIDEVALFGSTLSDAQVRSLYETAVGSRVPQLRLQLDLDNGPFGSHTFTLDATDRWVGEFDTWRGRRWRLGTDDTGEARFELRNHDRAFDPQNTASPYNGKLKIKRAVRLVVDYYAADGAGLHSEVVWYGFIRRYRQRRDTRTCVLECHGARWLAADIPLEPTPYDAEVAFDNPVNRWSLEEPDDENIVYDSVGKLHGTWRGANRGQASVLPFHGGASAYFEHIGSGTRHDVSGLITGYPFSIECWIELPFPDRTSFRQFFTLCDPTNLLRSIELFVPTDGFISTMNGEVVALVGTATDSRYTGAEGVEVDNSAPHHVVLVCSSSSDHKLYVDGVDRTVALTAGTPGIAAMNDLTLGNYVPSDAGDFGLIGNMDEVAIYLAALSATRVAAHYNAGATGWGDDLSGARIIRLLDLYGWPSAMRTINGGNTRLQGVSILETNLLAALDKITATELGRLYETKDGKLGFRQRHAYLKAPYTTSRVTFDDEPVAGSTVAYEAAPRVDAGERLTNYAKITRRGGRPQISEDASSISSHGLAPAEVSDGLHADDNIARDHSQHLVQTYATARTEFEKVVLAPMLGDVDQSLWAWSLDLDDRVTVVKHEFPVGSPTLSAEQHVQGIRIAGTKARCRVELVLSTAPPVRSYLVLDDATLGRLSSGNLLAY